MIERMMRRFNDAGKWVRFSVVLTLIVFLGAMAVACDDDDDTDEEEAGRGKDKVGVVVTLLPQSEFAEKVGGDKVDITVMVPPGASPHTYEPTPGQMTALAEADMYAKVGSGVEFELVWMDKLINQNKEMLVIDCSEGIELIEMSGAHEHEDEGHEHEHEGEHEHEDEGHEHEQGGMDPHIWMSPKNAIVMVQNICNGLVLIDPENKSYYESNRDSYIAELTKLDQDMETGLANVTNRVFMVYHPAFGYLAHTYDLTMLPIEEEGKEPTAAGLAKLIEQAKEHNIKVIFTSPQFDPQQAETIADEIGGRVVPINPLARDYIDNLQTIKMELIESME